MGLKKLYRSGSRVWDEGIKKAVAQNVITEPKVMDENLPLPVVVLSFIGAQVTALILIAFFALILIQIEPSSIELCLCFIGSVCLVGSLVFCRSSKGMSHPFWESLSLSGIMVGIAMLAIGTAWSLRHFSETYIFLCLASMSLICTCLVPKSWMRMVGGFASAIFLYCWLFFFLLNFIFYFDNKLVWTYMCCVPFIAAGGLFLISYFEKHARWARALWLKPVVNGWLTAAIVILAFSYGQAMFMNVLIGFDFYSKNSNMPSIGLWDIFKHSVSGVYFWVAIAFLYGVWFCAAQQCTLLKSKRIMALLAVATVFSIFSPSLALCVGIALLTYANKQYKLAVLAGLACLWIIGAFYTVMWMPLGQTAMWLAVMGVLLIGASWAVDALVKMSCTLKTQPEASMDELQAQEDKKQPRFKKGNVVLLAIAAVAIFAGVNGSIVKQEAIRSSGTRVLLPLRPVDPRSIMQGDYMVLNFDVPREVLGNSNLPGYAYVSVDEQGVGHFTVEAQNDQSIKFNLKRQGARSWSVPADAWFFKEGQDSQWSQARYGIFIVTEDGASSLVGMATKDLKPIEP